MKRFKIKRETQGQFFSAIIKRVQGPMPYSIKQSTAGCQRNTDKFWNGLKHRFGQLSYQAAQPQKRA